MVNALQENTNLDIGSQQPVDGSRKGEESNASRPAVSGLLRVNGGAFQIARKMFQSEIWLEKPSTWKVIWIYIIGNVNHKPIGTFGRGEGFFMFSKCIEEIGKDITKDMIKKSISFFKKSGMISTKRSTRGMRIKVIKYNEYQTLDTYQSTSTSTKKAPRKHQESTPINKNDKNVKNDKVASQSDAGSISLIIDLFKEINPTYERLFSMPPQRAATDRLLVKFGLEKLSSIVKFLPKSNASRYAPTITTPVQLERDLGKLIAWGQKEKDIKKTNVAFV